MTDHTMSIEDWCAELSEALGLTQDIALRPNVQQLLDTSRDAAQAVSRPVAPLTTYLIGLAAGLAGGTSEAVDVASLVARDLALSKALEQEP